MRRIAGAMERIVRRNKTCKPVDTCSGFSAFSIPKLTVGTFTARLMAGLSSMKAAIKRGHNPRALVDSL